METQTVIVIITVTMSVVLLFALPVLQFLAFCLLIFIIVTVAMTMTHDGDLLLMLCEKWGADGSNLKGKVAWVTGASSGIGEALCYELARKGVKLILSARREKELVRVKGRCLQESSLGDNDVLLLPLDVLNYESHKECAQKALDHFQKIDILVNNAGRTQRALAIETSFEVDKAVMDLNFLGQLSVTKSILPHMIAWEEGHIVNISSVAGKIPSELSATYGASKHALHSYFETLAYENDCLNITNICPGPVKSNIIENGFGRSLQQTKFKKTDGSAERSAHIILSGERCASLILIAIANNLSEAWICKNLPLLLIRMYHWSPLITMWIKKKVYGKYRIKAFHKSQMGTKN